MDEQKVIRNIGVLTSGGDAPGMNAAIRAVTRTGLYYGYRVYGIRRGFHGLWRGDIEELNRSSVSEKLQRGGTFLMTARSKTFNSEEGVNRAIEMIKVSILTPLLQSAAMEPSRAPAIWPAKASPSSAFPARSTTTLPARITRLVMILP